MQRMLPFEFTIFLFFKPAGRIAFFFFGCVISSFTFGTGQCYDFSRHLYLIVFAKMSRTTSQVIRDAYQNDINSERNEIYISFYYSIISVTLPEATVRPPSRMAKRNVFSIAIGTISSTVIVVLSPGITISTPSGREITPVTSVVRK